MSPKRSAESGPPKLGFLAQLSAKVGLRSTASAATADKDESSIGTAARSLFSEISKFRKHDNADSEDKENGSTQSKSII